MRDGQWLRPSASWRGPGSPLLVTGLTADVPEPNGTLKLLPGSPDNVQVSGFTGAVFADETIALSCAVTGGNPTPTVQWYRDGIPIVTTADYTFTAAGEDDGVTFRCVGTNPAGSKDDQVEVEVYCQS